MKKIILLSALLIFACGFSQGDQLYADGVATDQDGNQFEWINYGTQDWAIENAKMVTYRDGTPIPYKVGDQWLSELEGAWCYLNDDPNEITKLYNWLAVMGIYDLTSYEFPSLRKEFAPEGWHVPSTAEWETLEEYLIANGYNYDGTTTGNHLGKALASTTGWSCGNFQWDICVNPSTNNSSGFNAYPVGSRQSTNGNNVNNNFTDAGILTTFRTSDGGILQSGINTNNFTLARDSGRFTQHSGNKREGYSVRFVRDAQPASVEDNSMYNFKIFPNPTKEYLNIYCSSLESVSIYNILGKELIRDSGNRINVSSLSKGVYFIKVSDGIKSSTKRFVKN
jgi:uncharacterized protein (TIGR02145 family)